MSLSRTIFKRLYKSTPRVEDLAWHREHPPTLLESAVAQRTTRGRALDLGCGEGVSAVWLAQQGYAVTAIDFVPAAVEAARERADAAGVEVELLERDVLQYTSPEPFDIVLDSGCRHHMDKAQLGPYRAKLDEWLAPGGDYVLVHFAHRPRVAWIPKGPGRITRDEAVAHFAPFELRAYEETTFDVPFPMGKMNAGVYWFTRPAGYT